MPVILETISWILKNVNVGVERLIVGYGVRFVYSVAFALLSNSSCTNFELHESFHSPKSVHLKAFSVVFQLSAQYIVRPLNK